MKKTLAALHSASLQPADAEGVGGIGRGPLNFTRPNQICTRTDAKNTRTSQNLARAFGPSKILRGSNIKGLLGLMKNY